jgi:hypothetical protein
MYKKKKGRNRGFKSQPVFFLVGYSGITLGYLYPEGIQLILATPGTSLRKQKNGTHMVNHNAPGGKKKRSVSFLLHLTILTYPTIIQGGHIHY